MEHKNRNKILSSRKNIISLIVQIIGLVLFAFAFFLFLDLNRVTPQGADVWGHVYKAHHMFETIKSGNFYPLFDMYWYNGIETFRYWGPVSYYLYCIPLLLTGGKVYLSYRLFVSMMIFLAGLPWILIGIDEDKSAIGFVGAVMWFMLPSTSHVLIAYGNVPQIGTIMLTPYVILFLRRFVKYEENSAAAGLIVSMALMTVTHLMLTAITGISAFIYLLIDSIFNKGFKRKISALGFMVCGIVIMGIWFLPALSGGIIGSSGSGESVASVLVTELKISLDPLRKYYDSSNNFYFGLSLVLVSIFGIIASNKKNKAGFIFLILIMFMTEPSVYEVISHLPFSGLMWMERFTPIAYAFFLTSLVDWTSVKKFIMSIMVGLIILDSAPFYSVIQQECTVSDEVVADIEQFNTYISYRGTVIDLSSMGPYPSYAIPNSGHFYTFGWAWQGAITADNIMNINESLEGQKYLYMFDRCIELGDDAVLVQKYQIPEYSVERLYDAAVRTGYALVGETNNSYFFKLQDVPGDGPFGVITTYRGLALGRYAGLFTTRYPAFCYASSDYVDDYTVEELSAYDTIFLTGFEYHDKEVAEDLLRTVSTNGTRIVIDASHLPIDSRINESYFLGVVGSKIQFKSRYPALNYYGQTYYASDFSVENSSFSTEYFDGTDNVYGFFNLDNTQLAFLGNNNDYPEIYFLGLNIVYEAMDVEDDVLYMMVDDLLGIDREELPVRELVPLDVDFTEESLVITSPENNVNTTIACSECFESSNNIKSDNNLLIVNSGTTVINYHYSMLKEGIIMSLFGIFMTIVWSVVSKKILIIRK